MTRGLVETLKFISDEEALKKSFGLLYKLHEDRFSEKDSKKFTVGSFAKDLVASTTGKITPGTFLGRIMLNK